MKQEYSSYVGAFNCAELAHWFKIPCKLYKQDGLWYVEF